MGIYQKIKDWYTGPNELESPGRREALGTLLTGLEMLVVGGGVLGLAKNALADDLPEIAKMYPWNHVQLTKQDRPKNTDFHWVYKKQQWIDFYNNDDRCRKIFSTPKIMDEIMQILTDNNSNNDELRGVVISRNNKLAFNIASKNFGFKTKRGVQMYYCYINLDSSDAEYLKKSCPC